MMRRETFHRFLRILIPIFLLLLGVYATIRGLELRRALFDWSAPIHHGDYVSGFYRGRIVHQNGIFDTYDKIAQNAINGVREGIDYAPLRLTAVALWADWFDKTHSDREWDKTNYDDTKPMLMANVAAEWSSSVLVFLLVRLWWVRSHATSDWRGTFACVVGFIGALLFWFNPAILWDAHCWPQWDVWLLPFFLGALLLACTEWWFAAGTCAILGAFFKGQILLVAPLFILWPLFQGRWWPALRCLCGAVTFAALLAAPWMLRGWTREVNRDLSGVYWFSCTVFVILILPLSKRLSRMHSEWALLAGAAVIAIPALSIADASFTSRSITTFIAIAAVLSAPLRWRTRLPLSAALIAAAAFMLIPLYGASSSWLTIGFEYGTKKFTGLASAPGTYSIPPMLAPIFQWPDNMDTLVSPLYGVHWEVPIGSLMWGYYAICLVLCAGGAAINDRRKDSRFLIAAVAPWICFFSLLTQMNNRYMVWGAALPALLVGTDIGLTLLGLLLSGIAVAGMCYHMMGQRDPFAPEISQYIYAIRSNLGWAVALIGAIFLYSAVVPRKRKAKYVLATDGAPMNTVKTNAN